MKVHWLYICSPNTKVPISFFSSKLSLTQLKCNTFSKELLAIYLAIKHFRRILEGRRFNKSSQNINIRIIIISWQIHTQRILSSGLYITVFNWNQIHWRQLKHSDWCTIPDKQTILLKTFLAIIWLHKSKNQLNFARDTTKYYSASSANPIYNKHLYCDISTSTPWPNVSPSLWQHIFDYFQSLSHWSKRATLKLISERFVWSGMNKDVRFWIGNCINYQHNVGSLCSLCTHGNI